MTSITRAKSPKTTAAAVDALRSLDDPRAGQLADVLDARRAPATRHAYAKQWRIFERWCSANSVQPLPAEPAHVAAYISDRLAEGAAVNTIRVDRSAIRDAHLAAGLDDPTAHQLARDAMAGALRLRAAEPPKQASALTAAAFAAIAATAEIPRRGRGGRLESAESARRRAAFDLAMIATARDGMLRCSELRALRWSDVERAEDGSGRITIRTSKTDQQGEGAVAYLSRDTLRRLEEIRGDADDQALIFNLSVMTIHRRIGAAAAAAGLDGRWSSHSMRIGMARDLAAAGIDLASLQVAGRWSSPAMPGRYIRAEEASRGAVARYYQQAA